MDNSNMDAAQRLESSAAGRATYDEVKVSVANLRAVLRELSHLRRCEQLRKPECAICDDTGSKSKVLGAPFDCTACGRAEENVRVEKWYAGTMLGHDKLADVLNIYYHGKEAGAAEARTAAPVAQGWISVNEQRPLQGQFVCVALLTIYTNAPPRYDVTEGVVYRHGQWEWQGGTLRNPTHWMPMRPVPESPPLPATPSTTKE